MSFSACLLSEVKVSFHQDFEVDFDAGAISMTQSESLSVSTTAQISQPGSTFSTVA